MTEKNKIEKETNSQINFDYLFNIDYKDTSFEYGIINGNNKILLIKPGLGGDLLGKNNKFYLLGRKIHKLYGYTVICSNNPKNNIDNPLDDAFKVISDYTKFMNFKDYEVYYLGDSNGGVIGARFAYLYPNIKRALLINPPLFISYHKLKDGMLKFNGEKMVLIFGTLDPSYKFVEFLDNIDNDKISYKCLENYDHNLSDDLKLLISIVEENLIK